MKKHKKIWSALGAVLSTLSVALAACGPTGPAENAFELSTHNAAEYKITDYTAKGGTDTTKTETFQKFLNETADKPTVNVNNSDSITTSADYKVANISLSAKTIKNKNFAVEAVTYDGIDSGKLNVLIKVTEGEITGYYVQQVDSPKGKLPVSVAQIATSVGDPLNNRWLLARGILDRRLNNNGFSGKTTNLGNPQTQQNQDLQNKLNNGAKAVIASAFDATLINPVISQAFNTNKVPFIAYDRLSLSQVPYKWYGSYDNELIGQLMAVTAVNFVYGKPEADYVKLLDANGRPNKALIQTFVETNKNSTSIKKGFYYAGGSISDNNSLFLWKGTQKIIEWVQEKDDNVKMVGFGSKTKASQLNAQVIQTDNWDPAVAGRNFINKINSSNKSEIGAIIGGYDGLINGIVNASASLNLDWTKIWTSGQDFLNTTITGMRSKETQAGSQYDMSIYKPDTSLASILVSLATFITKFPKATLDEIHSFVKLSNPSIGFTINTTDYDAKTKDGASNLVNAFLLQPVIVEKSNVDKIVSLRDNAQ